MDDGRLYAAGPCWSCGRVFTFDPDLVPSIPIDPETGKPLDADDAVPTPEAYARSVKHPVCAVCIVGANVIRERNGRELIPVLPGAYPFNDD